MYNGIGLQTARGSGTNGYVQSNLSNLLYSKHKIEYNGEEDLKRMEAELNKRPNEELILHQKKRAVEIKCVEFELLMEEKGFDQEEIDKKVSDYRKLLLSQLESGELNLDDEIQDKDSHTRRKMGADNRDRMRMALGVKKDHAPGSSFQNMNKGDVVGAALEVKTEDEEKQRLLEAFKKHEKEKKSKKDRKKKEKAKAKKQKNKKRKRDESSSSSSSSSDSDSDSSDSSDSSSSSSDSSSSDSSEEERRKRKRKKTAAKKEEKPSSKKIKKEIKEEPRSPSPQPRRESHRERDTHRDSHRDSHKDRHRREK